MLPLGQGTEKNKTDDITNSHYYNNLARKTNMNTKSETYTGTSH